MPDVDIVFLSFEGWLILMFVVAVLVDRHNRRLREGDDDRTVDPTP